MTDATPSSTAPDSDVGVIARLRRLILSGQYPPGHRLGEEAVAEALGVSRTPVRLAFRTLEQEGLLHKTGRRGLVVREFTEADVLCALEVRGVLEGLAARRLAERGLSPALQQTLQACVDDGRSLLAAGRLTVDDIGPWSRLNQRFHQAIVAAAGSAVVGDAIARNNHLPFASAEAIVIDSQALDREYQKLRIAQWHHELVLQALLAGESARVEMLMREHACVGLRYGAMLGLASPAFPAAPAPTPHAGEPRR
jgi:GntR family transcriptional regulator, vanillate catabolism transcriptional regulator